MLIASFHPIAESPLRPSTRILAAMRAPASLPDGLADLLFSTQWTWWIAAIALGAVLMYVARTRADVRLMRAGQGLLVLALLWIIAARSIDTRSERLYAAHADMADAAQKGDVDRIVSHLSPTFSAEALNIQTDPGGARDEIAAILKERPLRELKILNYTSTHQGQIASTTLTIFAQGEGFAMPTTWQLSWDDRPDSDWKVGHAKLLKIGDQPASALNMLR